MTSLGDPGVLEGLLARLAKLHEKRPRAWGKMTAHEMMCHLADSFAVGLGERAAQSRETWMLRTIGRRIALHTTLAWPKSIPTMPEVQSGLGGTCPSDFEADRERLVQLMRRFAAADAKYGPHPALGKLTREEWLIWGYRHTDHHLRQFAL
jgi:hypothetical protein